MGDIVEYAVRGIPIGCVFALLAVGLVLTYRTSGVFNLAFAAQAYASAAVFYVVRKEQDWALLPAFVLAVVITAPLLGLLLERTLFRHLRTAPALARTVTALGLLVALPEIVKLLLGDDVRKNPPPLWYVERTDEWLWPEGSRFVVDAGQAATIVATAVVAVALTILMRRSALGLQMRAVVESARMAELSGVDADRVSMTAWALSSAIAGLTGVLLAPLFAELLALNFFTLLVAALAASVVGRLVSIPLAFAGGIGLGVLQAVLAGVLPTDSVVATGLRPALPFVVLFVLLVLRPRSTASHGESDPLAGVDPPPLSPRSVAGDTGNDTSVRVFGIAVAASGVLAAFFLLDTFWRQHVISGLVLAIILLSFTVLTGLGGMLSLCQATFAAIGAFTTAQLVDATGAPVLGAILVGAAVAAAAGGLLAIPLLRLDSVYLTLATLAFALMFENVLVPLNWVSGGATPLTVPRPIVAGFDFSDDRSFLVLTALALTLTGVVVTRIKHGSSGRFLDALRTSESGAVAVGIGPVRQRVVAFALAAGIAGFGGGMTATWAGSANYTLSFPFFLGLVWAVLVITLGARSVPGAVIAGLSFGLVPELLQRLPFIPEDWTAGLSFVLFGLGALTYARHPEGIVVAHGTALAQFARRRASRGPRLQAAGAR